MFCKNALTLFAVAMMAVGTSAVAQETTLVGLLTADENCGKDAANKAGCDPRDTSWMKPNMDSVKNRVKVGFGVRTSFQGFEDRAESNGGRTRDFSLDNARIFLSGKINDKITAYLHTDINNAQGFSYGGNDDGTALRILDAAIDYQISDNVAVKFGRFLPSTDRSNLSGPFFLNAWEFPFVQYSNGYYDIFQGRDDGVSLYGERGEDVQVKWSLGLFEGYDTAGVGGKDRLWMVGRVVLNFLDPEEGYFNSSTYYGEKDIAALGFSFSNQNDAHGTGLDYTAWSMDLLFETTIDSGAVVTLEGAYYDRDHDNSAVGNGLQGEGYFILGSYLFSDSTSIGDITGRLQSSIRYQESDRDVPGVGAREHQVDYSLNYIIHGHNARVSLILQDINLSGGVEDQQNLIIGGQVRF